MKKKKVLKGFFFIEGLDVMFLDGTPFNECKQIKNDLTIEEYNKAIGKIVKSKVKKSFKKDIKDKSLKVDLKDK
jgi:hypothetical protein